MAIGNSAHTTLPLNQRRFNMTHPSSYETLSVRSDRGVLFVEMFAPPMNLLGPALVRDLVSVIENLQSNDSHRVVVFSSRDPEYFISHVDVTKVAEYREAAAKLTGEASIGLLFRHLSAIDTISIAQIEGRARGAGSEFALACDMQFAATETAVFSQFESALGLVPGGGGMQHLVRTVGRGRALEILLSANDFPASLAEHYGWINRAIPAVDLAKFVESLAMRIAAFPSAAQAAIKGRVNAVALASPDDFRTDSDLFGKLVREPAVQLRMKRAVQLGFQSREPERNLGELLDNLDD
jgi:enoyl-CoA hydratase/carnithine racemase